MLKQTQQPTTLYFSTHDLIVHLEHEFPPRRPLRVGPGVFAASLCDMATPAKCLAVGRVKHRAAKLQRFDMVNLAARFAAFLATPPITVKDSESESIPT